MAEVLSQQEIDQLLNNMKTGSEESSPSHQDKEAIPFDFRLPNRISKNQLRTIRNIHENFAEIFSSFLMSKLQSIININVISVIIQILCTITFFVLSYPISQDIGFLIVLIARMA